MTSLQNMDLEGSELKDRKELDVLAEHGTSALADVLRRARAEKDGDRAQHHSYNSHSSNPW